MILNPPPHPGFGKRFGHNCGVTFTKSMLDVGAATPPLDLACFLALAPASLPSVHGRGGGLRDLLCWLSACWRLNAGC